MDLGEQASVAAFFKGEAATAAEFCGGLGIDDEGSDVPPSLVVISVMACDLIGAKVIWEVYM